MTVLGTVRLNLLFLDFKLMKTCLSNFQAVHEFGLGDVADGVPLFHQITDLDRNPSDTPAGLGSNTRQPTGLNQYAFAGYLGRYTAEDPPQYGHYDHTAKRQQRYPALGRNHLHHQVELLWRRKSFQRNFAKKL